MAEVFELNANLNLNLNSFGPSCQTQRTAVASTVAALCEPMSSKMLLALFLFLHLFYPQLDLVYSPVCQRL